MGDMIMRHQLFSVFLISLIGTILIPNVFAENVPAWIKNNAGWWAEGQIDDSTFVSGIEWLVSNDVITIPPTERGTGDENNIIPNWIKNNAGWWADDKISEAEFINSIQFLIKNGVMLIPSSLEKNIEFCSEDRNDLGIHNNVKDELCDNFFDSDYISISRFPSSGFTIQLNSLPNSVKTSPTIHLEYFW